MRSYDLDGAEDENESQARAMEGEMRRLAVLIVLGAATGAVSLAVVPDTGSDTRFPWVGQVGGATGTAIAARTVITARHNGTSTYGWGEEIYYATHRIEHPTADIALLIFDTDLPGWHALGADAPIDSPISMVGWGHWGTLNDAGDGYVIWWWSGGKRIAAPNALHEKWNVPGVGPSLISWLNVNGDAAAVAGDSGGAFFIDDKLVGVLAFAFNNSGGRLPDYGFASQNGGVPYHGSGAIDLTDPEIRQWVLENSVPTCVPCDTNCDGSVNGFDVEPFVDLLSGSRTPCSPCAGDVNGDGSVNGFDIDGFADALTGNAC
ncbi:MAG: hypothetical protein CHACPFDD_03332 [Phycisphaerae bacterium]|nr:hypothetical protein [Phycisphaerae bacterium]